MDSVGEAPSAPQTLSPGQVEALFGDVLTTELQRPVCFLLYFKKDSTELTEESEAQIPAVIDAIHARQSVDTSVVGHTDTVGSNHYNVQLSQKRAAIVAQRLVDSGIDAGILDVSSHGERNLLIATGDEVFEPRNRRVEITVR
jgi:outer membrane protein OmpA-like peptidoglycan-associated protein